MGWSLYLGMGMLYFELKDIYFAIVLILSP
jgi:hypothetical protein